MSRCADSNCGYYYAKEGEDYPRCQYLEDDPFPAPCEYDDYSETDDDYEEDYNDYEEDKN
jgi:hypothetical protein